MSGSIMIFRANPIKRPFSPFRMCNLAIFRNLRCISRRVLKTYLPDRRWYLPVAVLPLPFMLPGAVLFVSIVLFIGGCGDGSGRVDAVSSPPTDQWALKPGPDDASQTVRDMLDRTVIIPKEVQRVIGLRAGAVRMLTYLNAVDLIVGIEEPERRSDRPYLTAFPELRDLPPVGPQMGGDPELLVAASPDLIFLTFTSRGQADELQSRTGIPVIALEYGDFSDQRETFFSSLRLMAAVTGKTARAHALIAGVRESIAELEERTSGIPGEERPRAYIGGVSYRGARGINSTEPFYPPFRFVKAVNVAGEIHARLINPIQGTYIDIEQLMLWNPDVLFLDLSSLTTAGFDIRPGTPLARSLTAIRNGNVHGVLPYNNYAANYEAILANAWYTGSVLYPERFDDIIIAEKADQIFHLFFGRHIYDDIRAQYGGGYRRLHAGQP